jgi:hypothetical protein
MGDFALICEVKDKDLLNKLLEIHRGWKLLSIKKESFIVGFPRETFIEISKFNENHPHYTHYQYFWEMYLFPEGNPREEFKNFLRENKDFYDFIRQNFSRYNHNKAYTEKKIKEMNKKIKLLQEMGDCYIECHNCEKEIKLPSGYEVGNYVDCSFCEHGKAIHDDANLSKVIILKQIKEPEKAKKRFWK